MTTLVTGAAGFIGFHTARALLDRGETVIGLDNLNDYYDVSLKRDRLAQIADRERFTFAEIDLKAQADVDTLFAEHQPRTVINLAAQAGVRYSIENPRAYIDSNIVGFANILEACRHTGVEHLVFASSSSVYGANTAMPFSEQHGVDHPLSLYAASKKSNELMAHTYAHLYGLPCTGLRFFTVYGPWGRPDMAPIIFTRSIMAGEAIKVFNHGRHRRDFTFIDDIVDGVLRVADQPATPNSDWDSDAPDPATSSAPYRLYNIGNNRPVELMHFIACLEQVVGRKAQIDFKPLQPGDVPATYADIDALAEATGFAPTTSIEDGVEAFVAWYKGYYGKN